MVIIKPELSRRLGCVIRTIGDIAGLKTRNAIVTESELVATFEELSAETQELVKRAEKRMGIQKE